MGRESMSGGSARGIVDAAISGLLWAISISLIGLALWLSY